MERQRQFYHNKIIKYLLPFCLLLMPVCVCSQYRTATLDSVATQLDIKDEIRKLEKGAVSELVTFTNERLTVSKDEKGMVTHIGLKLFSDEIRKQIPSPVYDCIEFSALDQKYKLSENDLLIQKIKIISGSWQDVYRLSPTDGCSISLVNDKYYLVKWNHDGTDVVSMTIPVDYELLNHSSRRELERIFLQNLALNRPTARHDQQVDEKQLMKYGDTGFYVVPGDTFLLASLNRNMYYIEKTISQKVDTILYEEERPCILIERNYPAETMANMLIGTDPLLPDAALELEFQLSNQKKQTLNITLRQLLSFCQSQGCVAYYAYDNSDDKFVAGSLLLRNRAEGYNHLVNLTCQIDDLVSDVPVFKGRMLLYIPNVDAKHLFGTEAKKNSGMKLVKE